MFRQLSSGPGAALALAVLLTALVVVPSLQTLSADGARALPRVTEAAAPVEKAKQRGLAEGFQTNPLEPSYWKLVLDDPIDGQGQVFRFETAAYLAVDDQNPTVVNTLSLIPGVEPTTWQEAVAYIVASYAHVQSPTDLAVRQLDITTP